MSWYDEPTSIPFLSSAIRSVIVPGEGKKLFVSDLSSIEGRMLAWLAGEQWKLDAYYEYDNTFGFDLYVLAYANSFGVPPGDVGKAERQLGKVIELGLGYGGGVGAFITFSLAYGVDLKQLGIDMYDKLPSWAVEGATKWWEISVDKGKTYDLDEKTFVTCDAIKRLWRHANPKIVQFWYDLEDSAKRVLSEKDGLRIRVNKVVIDKRGTWMRIELPSGRFLSYPGARLIGGKIKYLGLHTYSRKWCNLSTYGGKLAENITQGASVDVFYHGLMEAAKLGYKVVLPVHDEGVTVGDPGLGINGLDSALSIVPSWAKGLPLAAKGFEGYRYRKD